ncbi:ATP synthase subunit d, mitochondrial [Erpetoichthys calabaricus]|uniref:ATP synthase subunit d, mitochondrial n=1 Tax=Erpetoichthys calabaricus TaxID=27687 RepID=UPI002234C827|nr:ATP synthase subunit d, mitochondrial [Erpetoichthys calabaricus]
MAGRRVTLKAIDWMAFAERVPPNQKAMFNALKTRSDSIAARLASLPEKPAVIDWNYYRTAVAKAGLVDEFEKKFSSIKVPEPADTMSSKIDAQEKEANQSALSYIETSKSRVAQYEKELEKLRNIIPFDQMTIDDLNEAFPETKLDEKKYPYWPHKPISEL